MFDGNYNQNKKRRTVRPLITYQGSKYHLRVGSKIGEIEISEINVSQNYFLGKYKNGKIDTLGFQN